MLGIDPSHFVVPPGTAAGLAQRDTATTMGWSEEAARAAVADLGQQLADLQERLYAEEKQGLLIVLQGMDTSGKDTTIQVLGRAITPLGCRVRNFRAPTHEELAHDFLWRVHPHAPGRGFISIFNRSHYEDVLIVRVHGWAPPEILESRYDHINAWERLLAEHGTRVVKIMLHISKDYQLERLRRRLARPDKHWKFNPRDLEERKLWAEYMQVYDIALTRTSTPHGLWHVVPSEVRWFRDLAVFSIVAGALESMNPLYPPADFDLRVFTPETLE